MARGLAPSSLLIVSASLYPRSAVRNSRPSEAGWAFSPFETMSKAPLKFDLLASAIAGSTKCLYSSGVHFKGTLKAFWVSTMNCSEYSRLKRKNTFRAHYHLLRVLQTRVESPRRIGSTLYNARTRRVRLWTSQSLETGLQAFSEPGPTCLRGSVSLCSAASLRES